MISLFPSAPRACLPAHHCPAGTRKDDTLLEVEPTVGAPNSHQSLAESGPGTVTSQAVQPALAWDKHSSRTMSAGWEPQFLANY